MAFFRGGGRAPGFVAALALSLFMLSGAAAQHANSSGNFPPVFELTNEDGAQVFLLGTIHLLPKETPWLSGDIIDSLESSDLIVLEADLTAAYLPEVQAYTLEMGRYTDGQTLDSELPDELHSQFAEILEEQGLSAEMFSGFRPWLVAILSGTAYSAEHGVIPQLGVDQFLQNWVFARGDLTIAYFESPTKSIDVFANLPLDQQIMLFELAMVRPADLASDLDELVDAWSAWDEDEIVRLAFGSPDTAPLRNTLLDDRNIVWVEQINGFASDYQTIFVAVGAGHLVGDNSLIELLSQQGWTLQE